MIYQPLVSKGYEWINTCDPMDYEVFWSFDGSRRAEKWKPIEVRRVRADKRQEFKASDFPWLGDHALIMRARALEMLRGVLEPHGEILPLTTDDGVKLFVFNVTTVLDALDEDRSSIMRVPGTQKIMRIRKAAFHASLVRDAEIFRLPHRASPTYVNRRFVDAFNRAGLVGLDFNLVWSEPS